MAVDVKDIGKIQKNMKTNVCLPAISLSTPTIALHAELRTNRCWSSHMDPVCKSKMSLPLPIGSLHGIFTVDDYGQCR